MHTTLVLSYYLEVASNYNVRESTRSYSKLRALRAHVAPNRARLTQSICPEERSTTHDSTELSVSGRINVRGREVSRVDEKHLTNASPTSY